MSYLINSIKLSEITKMIPVILTVSFLSFSCSRKIDTIKNSDIESLPSTTVKDFTTIYTDSAKIQLVMSSPLMERYTNQKSPYSEFRKGIKVLFHDGHVDPIARLSAKYAKFTEDKRIWELKDSVVAVNEKNEILETELLYWDQEKDIVYTDRFVKITSEDQIVMGTGLESNPRFTVWKIRNVSASIYIKDEK
jgi:LPS export ABC transporter protein LptC